MVFVIVAFMTAALVLAILGYSQIAAGTGVMGIVLFVANPVVWAGLLRSQER
jgi:hypothetical protein